MIQLGLVSVLGALQTVADLGHKGTLATFRAGERSGIVMFGPSCRSCATQFYVGGPSRWSHSSVGY